MRAKQIKPHKKGYRSQQKEIPMSRAATIWGGGKIRYEVLPYNSK